MDDEVKNRMLMIAVLEQIQEERISYVDRCVIAALDIDPFDRDYQLNDRQSRSLAPSGAS